MAGSLLLAATLTGGGTALAQSPEASAMVAPAAPTGLEGSITISGSSTVQPVSTAVQELFNAGSPGVAISVDGPGTGDGFALFCAGEIDIADASRAIRAEGEADVCASNGVEYVELKVALDGLSVITSAANDAFECLSFADVYALVGPESTGFDNWSDAQALATELGSTTTFPDAPLTITGPGEESGTYDFFVEEVIAPIAEERGQEAFTRPDYQSSANDLTILEGVGGTPDNATTLGWVGHAFVEENLMSGSPTIKALAVDGGDGCIAPTYEAISDGSYPISRPLFIYVNKAKAAEKPELTAFVDYYLTPGVIESVLQTVPYVGLSAEETAATADAWANR
jgi:phosphate transport system substrate-binding protein